MTKRQRAELEWSRRPLPPIGDTIRELESLSLKRYETKARTKNAIRDANLALAEALSTLHSYSKYEALVSVNTVETLHRAIRGRVGLDQKPKRPRRVVE